MATTKSGITLADGEQLVMELEAELWATSPNPIVRGLQSVGKVIAKILGTKIKGYLVITDKRVVEVTTWIACFCFTMSRNVKYVLPSSVKELGYRRIATCGCFCPMFYLYYESFTNGQTIQLKGVDEEGAKKIADSFYNAIAHANR